MKGAECLADMLVSGRAFGIAPGTEIPEVTAVLGGDYVEERYGRGGQRLLRRDYGLVEVTFNNEPDWACVWLSVKVHRLASHGELIAEALERYGCHSLNTRVGTKSSLSLMRWRYAVMRELSGRMDFGHSMSMREEL